VSRVFITGTGLYTPPQAISNEELVAAYNSYARLLNESSAGAIARGERAAAELSSPAFIEKASGIRSRHVLDAAGVLDPERMRPRLARRGEDQLSIQAEMSVIAAREALQRARRTPADVDAVVVACSNLQRPYPAVAIEVQQALGIDGFAYDMNVACSSATFGIQNAADSVARGHARGVLVINPEICSGHLNFRDRDSHFIFGDACTALLVEAAPAPRADAFEILGTRLRTVFSNNIRNDFGFLNPAEQPPRQADELLFRQNGRRVFREVVPMVESLILAHLDALGVGASTLRRLWLHQANLNMNLLIGKRVLGHEPSQDEAPVILDEYANTSSAGSIIAFHQHHDDLASGDTGVICSFGAGYSVGSVVVRRHAGDAAGE